MAIRLNWERVRTVHGRLSAEGFQIDTPITFLIRMRDGQTRKSDIPFKNFLRFFWALTESTDSWVETLIVQDKGGRVLFRYNHRNSCERQLPQGGNPEIVTNWNSFSQQEKDTYLRLIIAQINAYGQ